MFLVSVSKQFRMHNPFRIYNLGHKQLNSEILCQYTWKSPLWTCSPHILQGKEREGNLFMHPVSSFTDWHWDTCKIKKLQWWPSSPDLLVAHFLCCIFYFFLFPFQVWAPHFALLQYWILVGPFQWLRILCLKQGAQKGEATVSCALIYFLYLSICFRIPRRQHVLSSLPTLEFCTLVFFLNVWSVCYLTVY